MGKTLFHSDFHSLIFSVLTPEGYDTFLLVAVGVSKRLPLKYPLRYGRDSAEHLWDLTEFGKSTSDSDLSPCLYLCTFR